VFKDSGLEVKHYRYYDKKNINLDLNGMLEDIKVVGILHTSNFSLPQPVRSFCYMLVPIIQLESIRQEINGGRFPMRVN
jgi:hypothetical protein